MNNRTKIVNRLKTLKDIDGVEVTISDAKKTIYINFRTERSLISNLSGHMIILSAILQTTKVIKAKR